MFKEIIARTGKGNKNITPLLKFFFLCENIVPVNWVLCLQKGL